MTTPIIEVKNLWKKYEVVEAQLPYRLLREEITDLIKSPFRKKKVISKTSFFWALKKVNFSVYPGEAVGIIGPNGAGKTTLLKILSQITYPTKGVAIMRGRVSSLLEVGTGFSPELTGRENIYLNGAILGMDKKEIDEKLTEIINFAEIGIFIDVPVKRYSSGMYVRLAFSIAAHLEPEILLIDEVLAVGDARFQRKSLGKMDDVARRRGRTVVFVSHDLGAVRRLCKKAILIDKGKVIDFGRATRVIDKYLGEVNKEIPKTEEVIPETNRSGSGDIRIESVHFEDGKGRKIPQAINGKDFVVVFEFKAKRYCRDVKIGFNISDELGQSVILHQNTYTNEILHIERGKGSLKCKIPNLPLVSGHYLINLRVEANGQEADFPRLPVAKFAVVDGDFFGTGVFPSNHSPVLVKGKWFHT